MPIGAIDHVAMPIGNVEEVVAFYKRLGFTVLHEDAWRQGRGRVLAFALGDFKINAHLPELWSNERFTLRGPGALPGCGDLCFVWEGSLEGLAATLQAAEATVIEGPVQRDGGRAAGTATGTSLYTRDPDGNLLEFMMASR